MFRSLEDLAKENEALRLALASVLERMYFIDATDGLDPVSLTVVQGAARLLETVEGNSTRTQGEEQ